VDNRTGNNAPLRRAGTGFYLSGVPSLIARAGQEPGVFAHLVHRGTGLIICVYLLVHIIVIGQAAFNAQGFDSLMDTLRQPVYLVLDLLLFGAVIFHGLNGCRLILLDLGIGLRRQGAMVWLVVAATSVIMGWGLWVLWPELA